MLSTISVVSKKKMKPLMMVVVNKILTTKKTLKITLSTIHLQRLNKEEYNIAKG